LTWHQVTNEKKTILKTFKTSPTTEASPASMPATTKFAESGKDELKGSIVGLRASKFSSGLSAGTSPEPKPRTTGTNDPVCPPKPKPLPKPRPWSIVGVDRKSGELTSVVSDSTAEQKLDVPASAGVGRKSSVRDMIQNMNKGGEASPVTTTTTAATSDSGRRKGGSLPRGVQPPGSSSSAASSPNVAKKKDSTSDDPRILKLEDDYAFDDVMDV